MLNALHAKDEERTGVAHVDWLLRSLEISCVLVWHLFFMMCLEPT